MRHLLHFVAFATLNFATISHANSTSDSAMLSAGDPPRIAAFLREIGYRANLTKDSDGDPLIETAMSGYNVKIFFMNCKSGASCEDIQFFVGIATRNKLGLAQVNDFNSRKRFMRLYLDKDRDPLMELDLSMIGPGVSAAAFRDTVQVFERLISDLDKLISENQ